MKLEDRFSAREQTIIRAYWAWQQKENRKAKAKKIKEHSAIKSNK